MPCVVAVPIVRSVPEASVPCVIAVPIVRSVPDGGCGVVGSECVWSGSAQLDVISFLTLSSVVLGLRVIFTASRADRVAVSVNPLVSFVSLTNETKLSCGQCLIKCWEKCNAVVNVPLSSTVSMQK